MEIPVLLETLATNAYRATSLTPTRVSAEVCSREEAIQQIDRLMREQLAHAEIIQLNVPVSGESHPWHLLACTWSGHPGAAEFEQHMREYRRQIDADPDRL